MSLKTGDLLQKNCLTIRKGVTAFKIESYQRCTKVKPSPIIRVRLPEPPKLPTIFGRLFEEGDIPFRIGYSHCKSGYHGVWKLPLDKIDYEYYMPMFFHGLRETYYPYSALAEQGLHDMIDHGKDKIIGILPLLITPMRLALKTKIPGIMAKCLRVIQHMHHANELFGRALVPYYRQILLVFNYFLDFSGRPKYYDLQGELRVNIYEMLIETLRLMEQKGGATAFYNIKYMIPIYESSLGC